MDIAVDSPLDPRLPFSPRELRQILRCLAQVLHISLTGLCVRITEDRVMAELHQRFAGGLGPTNVLSFPATEPGRLGDMVLSAETVVREAELYLQPYRDYAVRLLAHGLLHLAGVPHGPAMEEQTERAVALCGEEASDWAWGEP